MLSAPTRSSAFRARALVWLLPLLASAPGVAVAGSVAILKSADVRQYDAAVRGFRAVLQHDVAAEYDMQGDFDRGRRWLGRIEAEKRPPDLILVVGEWALEAVVQKGTSRPTLFAMVLNPPAVLGDRSASITGASMNVPADRVLEILRMLGPTIHRVGVVFDPANTGYLLPESAAAASSRNLELLPQKAQSPGDVVAALEVLQNQGIDALWLLPDKTIPTVLEHVIKSSHRQRIPLMGWTPRHAEMGAVFALSFASSEDIGRQAGELANQTLAGAAGHVPFTRAREVELTVNLKAARNLGLEIPEDLLLKAHKVIR